MNPDYSEIGHFNPHYPVIEKDFKGNHRNFWRIRHKKAKKLAQKERRSQPRYPNH